MIIDVLIGLVFIVSMVAFEVALLSMLSKTNFKNIKRFVKRLLK